MALKEYAEQTSLQKLLSLLKIFRFFGTYPLNNKYKFHKCSVIVPSIFVIIISICLGSMRNSYKFFRYVAICINMTLATYMSIFSLVNFGEDIKLSIECVKTLETQINSIHPKSIWKPNIFRLYANLLLMYFGAMLESVAQYQLGLGAVQIVTPFFIDIFPILVYMPVLQFISFMDMIYFFLDKCHYFKDLSDLIRYYNVIRCASYHISSAYGPAIFINFLVCFMNMMKNIFIAFKFLEFIAQEKSYVRMIWFLLNMAKISYVIYFCDKVTTKVS